MRVRQRERKKERDRLEESCAERAVRRTRAGHFLRVKRDDEDEEAECQNPVAGSSHVYVSPDRRRDI